MSPEAYAQRLRLCDGLGIATGQLGTNAQQRYKVKVIFCCLIYNVKMKQNIIKEQKADASSVSQPIAKPYVARSFSENFDKKKFDKQWFWEVDFPNYIIFGSYLFCLLVLVLACLYLLLWILNIVEI